MGQCTIFVWETLFIRCVICRAGQKSAGKSGFEFQEYAKHRMGMEKMVFNFVGIESECNTGEGLRIYCLFSQKLEGIFKQPQFIF